MTRAERIAWTWVWCAVALVSVAGTYAGWRYGDLPFLFLETQICEGSNEIRAAPACDHVLSAEAAPAALRTTALRRTAAMAEGRGDRKTAIERITELIELGNAGAADWNLRGLSYYAQRDYEKAAKDFAEAARLNSAVAFTGQTLATPR